MMNKNKPIKRHPAIAVLSKDHHAALLLVWNIRRGLKNSVDPNFIGSYAIQFYEADLLTHFKDEEELLFVNLDASNLLRIQAEDEHKLIHALIAEMRKKPDDKELLERFATTLESHIRFEERILFNHLQEIIPSVKLAEIASVLNARTNNSCVLPSFPV